MEAPNLPEPWMRGPLPGVHPVISHLLRAAEQIREDAGRAVSGLTAEQIWSRPHGMTSAGFHLKHLAGSMERLLTYFHQRQLSAEQLAAIPTEGAGSESADELLALVHRALEEYESALRSLSSEDFGALREIGRKRHPATAIAILIHIAEHSQRHIGGLIAAVKLRPFLTDLSCNKLIE